mmetsp:Transcript_29577/g.81288  ORF Transcript_29577/g.81288 Transcript_29577/m.81288 type:complete len:140 (-) Transcript_29577:145-564(-)
MKRCATNETVNRIVAAICIRIICLVDRDISGLLKYPAVTDGPASQISPAPSSLTSSCVSGDTIFTTPTLWIEPHATSYFSSFVRGTDRYTPLTKLRTQHTRQDRLRLAPSGLKVQIRPNTTEILDSFDLDWLGTNCDAN